MSSMRGTFVRGYHIHIHAVWVGRRASKSSKARVTGMLCWPSKLATGVADGNRVSMSGTKQLLSAEVENFGAVVWSLNRGDKMKLRR